MPASPAGVRNLVNPRKTAAPRDYERVWSIRASTGSSRGRTRSLYRRFPRALQSASYLDTGILARVFCNDRIQPLMIMSGLPRLERYTVNYRRLAQIFPAPRTIAARTGVYIRTLGRKRRLSTCSREWDNEQSRNAAPPSRRSQPRNRDQHFSPREQSQ